MSVATSWGDFCFSTPISSVACGTNKGCVWVAVVGGVS